jgi:hypothetical protein
MSTSLALLHNQNAKMMERYMLFFKVFANSCMNRGDADPLTGEWSKLMKLVDGRTEYNAELLGYAQLVLDGKVQDEFAVKLLKGASIKKDAAGKPFEITISEASLADFDGVEIHARATTETMRLVKELRPELAAQMEGDAM